ncbi:MAG: hypothetical protein ACYCQM_06350 [Acidithiobacillus sp.]
MPPSPDLAAHYAQARDSVDKAQDAMFYANRKGGKSDPALTEKAAKVHETASNMPDMEGGVIVMLTKHKKLTHRDHLSIK